MKKCEYARILRCRLYPSHLYAHNKANAAECCGEDGRLHGANHVGNKNAQRAPERVVLSGALWMFLRICYVGHGVGQRDCFHLMIQIARTGRRKLSDRLWAIGCNVKRIFSKNKYSKMVQKSPVSIGYRTFWWGKVNSNHRSHWQQIYSLPPLPTREFPLIHLCAETEDWSWWGDSNTWPADYKVYPSCSGRAEIATAGRKKISQM